MRAARVDENQAAIVKELRALGMSVEVTSHVGGGFPDLCCGVRGRNYFFEVKNLNAKPSKRRKTKRQHEFDVGWFGQYDVILCAEDALMVIAYHEGKR